MSKLKTKELVEGAIMVALASALSLIKIFSLPWGGSVTLFSMLPIVVYSIRYGVKKGLFASFVFSLFQLFTSGVFSWGLTVPMLIGSILLDYVLAFTAIGFAGIFRHKGLGGQICGTIVAGLLRFISHFIAGVVIWHSFGELWSGFVTENEWLYSLVYNGAYMLPEIIFAVIGAAILFSLPQTKRLMSPQGN